jgi:hypothetical protein
MILQIASGLVTGGGAQAASNTPASVTPQDAQSLSGLLSGLTGSGLLAGSTALQNNNYPWSGSLAGSVNNTNNLQNTAQTGTNANLYNSQQQALQGALPGDYSSLLSGQIPTSYTAPQALINQYTNDFQNYQQPGIANQYGAGSPQISSQYNQGMVNLLGNQYNAGTTNYMNALSGAGNTAFQALGSSASGNTGTNLNQNTQAGTAQTNTISPLLQQLLQYGASNPGTAGPITQ